MFTTPFSFVVLKRKSIVLVGGGDFSLGRDVVLHPEIVINLPLTYGKLLCKGDILEQRLARSFATDTKTLLYYIIGFLIF